LVLLARWKALLNIHHIHYYPLGVEGYIFSDNLEESPLKVVINLMFTSLEESWFKEHHGQSRAALPVTAHQNFKTVVIFFCFVDLCFLN